MRLSDFILTEMQTILAEWDEFARTLTPAATTMKFHDLRNHAELMLRSIAEDIASEQSADEQFKKSHGEEARNSQIVTGEEHGIARLDSRFTMEQLAAEFRALRASVLKLWAGSASTSPANMDDVIRFNESIDQLLAASISSFAQATRKFVVDEGKRREQFLAMLAHELRNPLAPISASATLLRASPSDIETVRKAGNVIARQVSHITSLVDDLLEVSRVNSGSVVLKVEVLDFRAVVESALEQISPKIASKNHRLDFSQLAKPIIMLGDGKRLVQVLVNLLVNAAKYTPNGGVIRLDVAVHGDHAEVTVGDNGIGIAADFIPHVFEIFSQANPSIDRTSGGLGLGLPLVKSLVEQHSGKVTCSSAGIGKGSRFSISLPLHNYEAALSEVEVDSELEVTIGQSLKVMVVDDNVDAAETLALLLETLGYVVAMAHDPIDALKLSAKELPDAFLLDIGLPTMDGNELAQKLRTLPGLSDSVMIAVTGYSQSHFRDGNELSGFNHFMTKPVDIANLHSVLKSVLPIHRQT